MLRSKHLLDEIEKLEKEAVKNPVVKALILVLKLLKDLRTNQTLLMKNSGVELVKPKREEEKK